VRLGSFLVLLTAFLTAPLVATVVYSSYSDVRAVLTALAEIVPADLKGLDEATLSRAWEDWAVHHDREIRARLERGDEDTIVNWLLFGTSFSSRPRALFESSPTDAAELVQLVAARTQDLTTALQSPGADERRLFARQLLERKGYRFETIADREQVSQHLLTEVARVAREQAGYARDLGDIRRLEDVTEQFAARSRLFRARGLSLDTSILPSMAIERSLAELHARGLIAAKSVHEVAVIGPGLDFSDKSSGYDFYPQQTLQPLTLMDSLVRLGLIDRTSPVHVTTLDLSPRVNDHLTRTRQRASRGLPYLMRLPIDVGLSWKPEVMAYWNSAADRIGTVLPTPTRPAVGKDVRVRTVSIPPRMVLQIRSEDVNIVVQRLIGRRFDLIIATNVFVYYDLLDQALAFSNVEAMLRPGGFLLSNNSVLELPGSRLRSAGYLTVQYSDRPDDGDHIVWYRRLAD
jgi:hypothetical protein